MFLANIICRTACLRGLIYAFSHLPQGRASVADIIGFNGLEMISSKPDGRFMAFTILFHLHFWIRVCHGLDLKFLFFLWELYMLLDIAFSLGISFSMLWWDTSNYWFEFKAKTSSHFVGYLKCWDSSIDLVNVLKHEIRDGQLSFRGKRVLEVIQSKRNFNYLLFQASTLLFTFLSYSFQCTEAMRFLVPWISIDSPNRVIFIPLGYLREDMY